MEEEFLNKSHVYIYIANVCVFIKILNVYKYID